jgi:phosphatidylglycerophosphatase A
MSFKTPQSDSSGSVKNRHKTVWPSSGWVFSRPDRLIAFGFGTGLLRPGSGTWGTLLAAILWWPLQQTVPHGILGIALLLGLVVGIWICGRTANSLGVADHVGIVWDEIIAFWLLMWAIPFNWVTLIVAFVLFRFFDVYKPFPIGWFDQNFKGGFGVMVDDLIAAFYAWLLMMTWFVFVGPMAGASV